MPSSTHPALPQHDKSTLAVRIANAFDGVQYPGDNDLIESRNGFEPLRVEAEFHGKTDWTKLDPEFLDQAPDGLGSALSFFSDQAFHFYIAAYMLADLGGKMERSDPSYYLVPQSSGPSVLSLSNPLDFGPGSWGRYARLRFGGFSQEERRAVAAYLDFRTQRGDLSEDRVHRMNEAITHFWLSDAEVP